MKKLYNGNEIDTHTIILDSGEDHYDGHHHDDKKKLSCFKKDADCCFEVPEKVFFGKCQDKKEKTIGPIRIKCQARLLKINVILKKVCKGRKIAIGVLIKEDKKTRGFRGTEIIVPGEPGRGCVDLKITNFCFVLPEKSICDKKKVDVKVIAHYTDFDRKHDHDCTC